MSGTAGAPAADPPVPLRRNRDFQLLWGGQAISLLGSQTSKIAYPLLVLAMTGSPVKAGVAGFAAMLGYLLFPLVAGGLADRLDRKKIMIGCDVIRLAAVGSIAVAGWAAHITYAGVLVAAFVEGSASVFFGLAQRAAGSLLAEILLQAVAPSAAMSVAAGGMAATAVAATALAPIRDAGRRTPGRLRTGRRHGHRLTGERRGSGRPPADRAGAAGSGRRAQVAGEGGQVEQVQQGVAPPLPRRPVIEIPEAVVGRVQDGPQHGAVMAPGIWSLLVVQHHRDRHQRVWRGRLAVEDRRRLPRHGQAERPGQQQPLHHQDAIVVTHVVSSTIRTGCPAFETHNADSQ